MDAFIISYGQDTNGQNARFVKAAMRHGAAVMRSFAIGQDDPAGVLGRFREAAEKTETLRIREAHRQAHYFDWPGDIVWDHRSASLIRTLIRDADVLHLNNSPVGLSAGATSGKPVLLHHHGSKFRNASEYMLELAKRRKWAQAVSTIDLLQPDPKVLRWLPSAYDIDELQRQGRAGRRQDDGRVRIVHAPTSRAMKHTDLFLSVVAKLQAKYPVDLVLVEGRTNAECIAEKAKADIVYDQLMFGYGCNSIEAWGLGVPVVAGADAWTLRRMRDLWGDLPFANASEKTLYSVLEKLVQSAEARQEYAGRGLAHVRKYHDEKPALATLLELYDEAFRRHNVPRIQGKGVLFGGPRKKMHIDGIEVDFSKGPIEITDEEVTRRLRMFAELRPGKGIVEMERTG